jgi:S1-C subfamily serine protease
MTLEALLARGQLCAVRVLAHTRVELHDPAEGRAQRRPALEFTNIGSGVRFGPANRVVTSLSVIGQADSIEVGVGARRVPAEVLAVDPVNDLALLVVNDLLSGNQPPPPATTPAEVGEMVVMVDIVGELTNLQVGRVTAIHPTGLIVTSLTIHPGLSGAPLLNARGEIMGVVAFASEERSNQTGAGDAVAIPSNMVAHIASELEQFGQVRRGYFGAVSDENYPRRVVLSEVDAEGPAALAGLKAGDEVIRYAGQPIQGPAHLRELVLATVPGTAVPVTALRGGEELLLSLVIGDGSLALSQQLGAATGPGIKPDPYAVARWLDLLTALETLINDPAFDPDLPDVRIHYVRMEQTLNELRRQAGLPPPGVIDPSR